MLNFSEICAVFLENNREFNIKTIIMEFKSLEEYKKRELRIILRYLKVGDIEQKIFGNSTEDIKSKYISVYDHPYIFIDQFNTNNDSYHYFSNPEEALPLFKQIYCIISLANINGYFKTLDISDKLDKYRICYSLMVFLGTNSCSTIFNRLEDFSQQSGVGINTMLHCFCSDSALNAPVNTLLDWQNLLLNTMSPKIINVLNYRSFLDKNFHPLSFDSLPKFVESITETYNKNIYSKKKLQKIFSLFKSIQADDLFINNTSIGKARTLIENAKDLIKFFYGLDKKENISIFLDKLGVDYLDSIINTKSSLVNLFASGNYTILLDYVVTKIEPAKLVQNMYRSYQLNRLLTYIEPAKSYQFIIENCTPEKILEMHKDSYLNDDKYSWENIIKTLKARNRKHDFYNWLYSPEELKARNTLKNIKIELNNVASKNGFFSAPLSKISSKSGYSGPGECKEILNVLNKIKNGQTTHEQGLLEIKKIGGDIYKTFISITSVLYTPLNWYYYQSNNNPYKPFYEMFQNEETFTNSFSSSSI